MQDTKDGITAKDLYQLQQLQHRTDITDQGLKASFLANAGANVALLAFLQAVWSHKDQDIELINTVLFASLFFSLGLAVAIACSFFRVKSSKAYSFNWPEKEKKIYSYTSNLFFWASVFFFLIGGLMIPVRMLFLLN